VHKHCALNTVRDASHRPTAATATAADVTVVCALVVSDIISIVSLCSISASAFCNCSSTCMSSQQ
jgi:hypothetical protein